MAISPIIPWEPCNFPDSIQAELNRRKVNRSFVYVNENQGGWDNETGEWTKYRGPMSPWVRFCSNGVGRELDKNGDPLPTDQIKEGFVFSGGKNFYNGYGFVKSTTSTPDSIIGYLPDGVQTHTILNDLQTSNYPIHMPVPEIEKINVTIQKELYRRATIEWVCFSKAQLEYMTPYFLVPGLSCILEWGWNHYDPSSLLNLTDITRLKELNNNPYPLYTKHILKSKGNYDVLMGRITNFEWTAEGNKFKCKTEITSQDRIYAGLALDASSENKTGDVEGKPKDVKPFGSLIDFIDKKLSLFRGVATAPGGDPENITELAGIVRYIKKHFPNPPLKSSPNASTWKDYVYGVFYGRDKEDTTDPSLDDAKEKDFDRKKDSGATFLNLGLVMEIINFHIKDVTSFDKKAEIFRVDIDDVVINAHPNLISGDGSVLLIPNAEAPKYCSGTYGTRIQRDYLSHGVWFDPKKREAHQKEVEKWTKEIEDSAYLNNATNPEIVITDYASAKKKQQLADYRVFKICGQTTTAKRDNLDELINRVRYENTVNNRLAFAFPFAFNRMPVAGSKPYPARYSGYLKDLYINIDHLKKLVISDFKTYIQLVEKLLSDISDAAGGFWDFRLVSGTGSEDQPSGEAATMKIVDYRFMNTANTGTPFTFDYFDANSLLMGIGFKPTLSDAQAIRTIYAKTNHPDKNVTVVNGTNELLDYKFRDRLAKDEDDKTRDLPPAPTEEFLTIMRDLQRIDPCDGACQMTMKVRGKIVVRRLALPFASVVLKLLLDDGDEEYNPKYTGIMPGIQATFTIQGIGGLRTFMMFLVRNLPEPYSENNIIFRIVDVQESIESGKWTTTITAGVIPLREHIKERLGIGTNSNDNFRLLSSGNVYPWSNSQGDPGPNALPYSFNSTGTNKIPSAASSP